MRPTSPGQKAEQKSALRTALVFVVVGILAVTIAIFTEPSFRYGREENHLLTFRLSYIAFAIIVLAVILICGHRLSTRLIRTVPLLLAGPAFPLTWVVHITYARAHLRYSPLLGYKLVFLMLS